MTAISASLSLRAERLRRRGVERRHAVLVSPLDKPNTVLILSPDSPLRLAYLGAERSEMHSSHANRAYACCNY